MAHHLSVGRILKRDWPSFVFAGSITVWWLLVLGAYLLAAVCYPRDSESWLIAHLMGVVGLVLTGLLGTVLVRRIHIIKQAFGCGEMVQGEVLGVGENSEDVGYAVVAYQYQGRQYLVSNVTEGAVGRGGLTPGARVDLMVDPRTPSRAFIAKLYLE
jgi:hypothetical protein